MLTGKYVVSPIDGIEYCRKNGQFLRHLISNGFEGYQEFFEYQYPDRIEQCNCGNKRLFDIRKMKYKQTCGNKECANLVTSNIRKNRTEEEWNNWKNKYQTSMSTKTEEEKEQLIQQRKQTAISRDSYKNSVPKREQTCELLYENKKYNNNTQISQTKLDWDESRKQLFKDRLKIALNGKILNDFHTEEMYVARRKMLEERGDIIPLDKFSEWEQYEKKTRNLTERIYRKHKQTINPLNLPRGASKQEIDVYQLDHIVPIFFGFMNNIPEYLIASLENLQILHWTLNNSKGKKYDPTISTKHKELENQII